MSEVKVNKISPRTNCGTVQLGDSGDTITIPSGATITNNGTQTGFGRTGTVNWVTTKKTASFTAANGEGYFVDTSSSAVTMTLPASPSAGDIVGVKDYAGTFSANNLTIGRNSEPINGGDGADPIITTDGASILLVYVDSTQGWIATQDDSSTISGNTYMVATGGTITTCGNCKIHTFTGPGTFTVCCVATSSADNIVSYMVIAGGGGAGGAAASNIGGGGGGAGGYRELISPSSPYCGSPLNGYPTPGNRITVTATSFPITVGGGGSGGAGGPRGTTGSNSTFSTITSAGGGYGGGANQPGPTPDRFGGGPGGSGGGSAYQPGTVGSGNDPATTPAQGKDGGAGLNPGYVGAGGGGGATAVGAGGAGNGPPDNTFNGGLGGAGATSCISTNPVARASGGSGGSYYPNSPAPTATPGGGGAGGPGSGGPGCNATANTGGGGGGSGSGNPGPGGNGGAGGSGLVIIRYRFQ